MAADAMLAEGHDGRMPISCTLGTFVPGVWQPLVGPTGALACDPAAWVKDAKPFLVESATQFRTPGPLALTSAAYAAEVNEVKSLGSLTSSTRTPAQSHAAAFWQTNPAANYNAIARRFADAVLARSERQRAPVRDARPDRGRRSDHRLERQVLLQLLAAVAAIRQADTDGNPATMADPPEDEVRPVARSSDRSAGRTRPAAVRGPPVWRHSYASASMSALPRLRYRRGAVLGDYANDSRPSSGRSALLRRDQQLVEAASGQDPFRTADVQAADLGREIERTSTSTLRAAH